MKGRNPISEVLSETAIVAWIAEAAAERVARKVIADLGRLNYTLSGEDSPLKTIWDEICVQMQDEESFFWEAYQETVERVIEHRVTSLPQQEYDAIWLQTDAASARNSAESEEREAAPTTLGHVIEYIAEKYVYRAAERWSNARIRAYFKRAWETD